MLREGEDICHIGKISFLNEIVNIDHTKPFDIHGTAADKVTNQPFQLGRAVKVNTFDVCGGFPDSGFPTYRANHGNLERTSRSGLFIRDYPHAFGDHFAGFFNEQGGTQADVQAGDKILVVERTSGNCGTAQANRIKHSGRRDFSGSADGQFNLLQPGFFPFWRVFIGDLIPRIFGGVFQLRP